MLDVGRDLWMCLLPIEEQAEKVLRNDNLQHLFGSMTGLQAEAAAELEAMLRAILDKAIKMELRAVSTSSEPWRTFQREQHSVHLQCPRNFERISQNQVHFSWRGRHPRSMVAVEPMR
jgi:hypothetical protein